MTDPINPTRSSAAERRAQERRTGDRRAPADGFEARLPVVIPQPPPSPNVAGHGSMFTAHVFGQRGQKNGLKGGAPVLNEARTAYLDAEWSGPDDRRGVLGRITKRDV
jgi:hypothetical protein